MISPKQKILLKQWGQGTIVLFTILLTVKFFLWNSWKVERAAVVFQGICKAPGAVNLVILDPVNQRELFRKGFPARSRENEKNYYIVHSFDITSYLDQEGTPKILLSVNQQPVTNPKFYRGESCFIISAANHYFVFPIPAGHAETLAHLYTSMPGILRDISPSFPQ